MPLARVCAAEAGRPTVTFQVEDELTDSQTDEDITVTINDVPVASLKLDARKPQDSFKVTLPAAQSYHYDLCGQMNDRKADGTVWKHVIDHGGELGELDGHLLVPATISAETVFFLLDRTPDTPFRPARKITAGHSCSRALSMRKAPEAVSRFMS